MARWVAVTFAIVALAGLRCGGESADAEISHEAVAPEVVSTVARRLTRAEYDNTVRDLLGVDLHPSSVFFADERGLGFDNVASLQGVSPEAMVLYERAAEQLAAAAMADAGARARLVPCDPTDIGEDACAARVVDAFGPRAFRRPLADAERDDLLDLFATLRADGDDFDAAIEGVVQATLMSPQFLFRVEVDPDPDACTSHPVSEYELASRLSYFLWSSMPDAQLFETAASGSLSDDAELARQVQRMLDDPRARALVDDFAGQWLYIRALDDVFKDLARFPDFDEPTRAAMKAELERFFASLVAEDRDLRELLTATETTIEPALAPAYGIAVPAFSGVRALDLTHLPRRGLLTMPGLMTVLARPFRTAPVKRGAWVLGQLMCTPPPPPPAGVEAFDLSDTLEPDATMRERLAVHRRRPECAGCHDAMDPIGLAFESYDAVGRFRRDEDGVTIDPSGTLPGGIAFADAVELGAHLADDPAFVDCVVRQTLTYALGRGLTPADEPYLEDIVGAVVADGYATRTLFVEVARSAPMRHRNGCEVPP